MLRGVVRFLGCGLLLGPAAAQAADPWWAMRPLARPPVPAVADGAWVRSPIDAFVLARLEANGLAPAPPADRHTLLRRATYDLTGLPPTDAEIAAFVADASPDAYERVVDRLLASPHYGVKWAQHWLDVVRYAETDGYERDSAKPFVWRYRDWVVDALNADLPYGEFVARQLAGDERPDATVADHVATGFYRLGIWDDEPTDPEQHRYDVLDGIADTTARATLAISLGCARCHDHKKDPLPQRDYYAFLACFENIAPYDKQATTVPADGARERYESATAEFAAASQRCRDALRRAAAGAGLEGDVAPQWREATATVARYDGERASPKRLFDATAGERHGEVHGQIVQVDGVRGRALRFDGDDHAVLPPLVSESFSVTFWVRSTERGRGRARDPRWFTGTGLVDGEVPGIVDDWGIAWLGDGHVVAGTGNPETFVSSSGSYADGRWHHVAFTRDMASGRVALYVDGQSCGDAVGGTQPLTAPQELFVGRSHPDGPGFQGDLDELGFWNRALTMDEVVALALELPGGICVGPAIAGCAELAEFAALRAPGFETVDVLAVRERGPEPAPSFVRLRGNVHAKGEPVGPGVPSMLAAAAPPFAAPQPTAHSSGRRTALARWIVDERNPLTWRVLANRLWQHHFGRGIVRSSNDFGRLGDLPTHPELLDWLACEVLANGQRLKPLHRRIVTSAAYRMSSAAEPKALAADPGNDLFWRFDRRRLTAEEVRDSMLAVDGSLNLALGGPSVFPPLPQAVLATASRPDDAWGRSTPAEAARRSLYVHVKRSLPEPLLASFDRADTDASCPVRFATVQPTQALTMLNGDLAQHEARRFAARLEQEAPDLRARLARGLALVTQRPADAADLERLAALAADLERDFGRSEAEALARCCLVLLNCNEFLFLD